MFDAARVRLFSLFYSLVVVRLVVLLVALWQLYILTLCGDIVLHECEHKKPALVARREYFSQVGN